MKERIQNRLIELYKLRTELIKEKQALPHSLQVEKELEIEAVTHEISLKQKELAMLLEKVS